MKSQATAALNCTAIQWM